MKKKNIQLKPPMQMQSTVAESCCKMHAFEALIDRLSPKIIECISTRVSCSFESSSNIGPLFCCNKSVQMKKNIQIKPPMQMQSVAESWCKM
jgi:hypothetical protein